MTMIHQSIYSDYYTCEVYQIEREYFIRSAQRQWYFQVWQKKHFGLDGVYLISEVKT